MGLVVRTRPDIRQEVPLWLHESCETPLSRRPGFSHRGHMPGIRSREDLPSRVLLCGVLHVHADENVSLVQTVLVHLCFDLRYTQPEESTDNTATGPADG